MMLSRMSFCAGTALVLALAAGTAQAQDKENANGDIIVTATRFETLASKTPIALTAVSGDTLRTAGITNPTNLGDQVPSVMINRNNGLQITIRGVSSSDGTEKGDPSAAFMQDGIYIARPQAQEVSFFDIGRVEVLRGPQGTLYGRNTTAGAVNIITNKPKIGDLSGSVEAAYGNYNNTQITGVVNLPVGDSLAVRLGVNYDHRDSFLKAGTNFPGTGFGTRLSPFKDNVSLRAAALWKFDKGEILIRGNYADLGGIVTNILPTSNFYSGYTTNLVDPVYIGKSRSTDQQLTFNAPTAAGVFSPLLSRNLRRNTQTYGVDGELKYDLGAVTLNYIGSYRRLSRHEGNISYNVGGLQPSQFDGKFWQNNQELRLSTNDDGPLRAQAGVYYFKERGSVDFFTYARIVGGVRTSPGQAGYISGFPQHYVLSQSVAGFGQLTYAITPELRLTAGARYTEDKKARIGASALSCRNDRDCNAPGDIYQINNAKRTYTKTTWKAGIDYEPNNATLLFGTVSTGYKAGGFNDGCEAGTGAGCTLPANALYYEPETLTAYEVGAKTKLLGNMLRLNLSAFHYDYKNLQLSQLGPFCAGQNCQVTTNAAAAKVDGVELESVLQPTRDDKIDFTASWINARYADFFPNVRDFPTLNFKGKKLDRSPTVTLFGGYTHTFALDNGGEVLAAVRSKYSASYKLTALNIYAQFKQPSYTSTEATLTYNAPGKAWFVQGYVKNIEDTVIVTTAGAGVNGTVQVGDPRTYGLRAGFKF